MPDKKNRIRIFKVTVLIILSVFVVRLFLFEFYMIPSNSMSPTLFPGDFVVVNKLSHFIGFPDRIPFINYKSPIDSKYWFKDFELNDIIIFNPPFKESPKLYTKRIIGLPGDTIVLKANSLFLNGKKYEIPLKSEFRKLTALLDSTKTTHKLIIPGEVCKIRIDSNSAGFWEKYSVSQDDDFYFNEDHYFVVGDNLPTSYDSRYWGFLPKSAIVGTPGFIYWSYGFEENGDEKVFRFERILKSID